MSQLADRFEKAATLPDKVEHQVSHALLTAKKLLVPILLVLVALLVLAIVVINMRGKAREARASAFLALSEAMNNGDDLGWRGDRETVLTERIQLLMDVQTAHPKSDAAAIAAFQIARVHYMLGNYEEAEKGFAAFTQEHASQREYATQAFIGEANALVEQGKYQAAMDKFLAISQVADSSRDAVLLNQAKYRAALCALALEKRDAARRLLEEVLAAPISEEAKRPATKLLGKLSILPVDAWAIPAPASEESVPPPAEEGAEMSDEEPAVEPAADTVTPE